MTKADLIAVIEKQANLPHHQAEKIVNICFDSMIQALFDDERIVSQILPVLFPTGATLAILEPYFRAQNIIVANKIADSIRLYLQLSLAHQSPARNRINDSTLTL